MIVEARCVSLGAFILAAGALPACFAWGISPESSMNSSSEGETLVAASASSTGPSNPTEDTSGTAMCSCDRDYVWHSLEGEPFGAFGGDGSLSINLQVDECCVSVTDVEITVAVEQYWFGNLTITLASPGAKAVLVDLSANENLNANTERDTPLRFRGTGDELSDQADIGMCWPGDSDVICKVVCVDAVECIFRPTSDNFSKLYADGVAGQWTLTIDSVDAGSPALLYSVGLKLLP